jgi:F-type H+-transporting ATPase subunit delta
MDENGKAGTEHVADVGAHRVARVYAEALLNAAGSKQQDAVVEELAALVRDVFKRQPQVEEFLSSGAISRDAKAGVIRSVFDGRTSDVFTNFLQVLNNHDRLDVLRPILTAARELANERAGRLPVVVRTAVPLPDDQRERLRAELRSTFKMEPLLDSQVDPELLGGMVVRVGDFLYDASVRARLESLRDELIARSSHEIQSRRDRFSSADGN